MTDFPAILSTLTELAEEHLASMQTVDWQSYASAIKSSGPPGAGETFGCVIDDRYFDLGDTAHWAHGREGDVELVSFAQTYFDEDHQSSARVERSTVIKMP